ncbi:hypothetical protein QLG12_11580 [Pseudomonas sp. V88_4]|uniref:hypothetical protein n=1 Tax=Pseudomonas sp. V88_4 TaxID=3044229 RepID=UPI00249DB5D8|nr:hypothetical protein [Pseudomonas sp. V88_4]MDI3398846.1 hypothetical protein [Pseudomonas sp. V88_4]
MLHAFNQGKSSLYRRYLGHREIGEKRVCAEDEITALIMGPLDYLPAESAGLFWRSLIERGGRDVHPAFPDEAADRAQMRFWPRNGVEPDLLVELGWPTGERRILLIEFKWDAPLSGDDQLHRQWLEFLTPAERTDAYHVFIAPDISAGLNALGERDVWNGQLVLHSWLGVLNIVRSMRTSGFTGLETWKSQITRFLGKLGIFRFQGFDSLSLPPIVESTTVFWSPLNGFSTLKPSTVPSSPLGQPFYFWSPVP